MIPKIIHYCWFGGGALPEKAKRCINSWRKYCPDYRIVEWNESNYDVNQTPYTKFCYEHRKWAFLSDYVRLQVVAEYGGIYFDTDVEVIRNFDYLLKYDAFYSFEDEESVNTGQGFGSVAGHEIIVALKKEYEKLELDKDGSFPIIKCPQLNTMALLKFGLQLDGNKQLLESVIVLPADYMNPYDDPTGKLKKTNNTFSIHWYSKSWMDKRTIYRSMLLKPFHRVFGTTLLGKIKRIILK